MHDRADHTCSVPRMCAVPWELMVVPSLRNAILQGGFIGALYSPSLLFAGSREHRRTSWVTGEGSVPSDKFETWFALHRVTRKIKRNIGRSSERRSDTVVSLADSALKMYST